MMYEYDAEKISNEVEGKTIKLASIDGGRVYMTFTDGTIFEYNASDAGYSTFELRRENKHER